MYLLASDCIIINALLPTFNISSSVMILLMNVLSYVVKHLICNLYSTSFLSRFNSCWNSLSISMTSRSSLNAFRHSKNLCLWYSYLSKTLSNIFNDSVAVILWETENFKQSCCWIVYHHGKNYQTKLWSREQIWSWGISVTSIFILLVLCKGMCIVASKRNVK